ncbi:MAG: transposase, partial [unclassified Hahellaceae]|nr:transposase [Hahellaceae bacterium]
DLTEMHTMLSERVKEWSHLHRQAGLKEGLEQGLEQGIEQGLERGIEQGLERGIELGEARTLKRLLTKRFGELSADALQRIDSATLVQLEVWLDRVLDADSLAAVLD